MDGLHPEKTDEQLARMVQEGDVERFGDLVERYERKITRYGKKFLQNNNNLEDLVQEVFIKAYRNIRSFDAERKFSSWLYRIAHNEFINELKKNTRHPFSFMDPDLLALHPAAETPKSEYERQEVLEQLSRSLSLLDSKYQEVLILYYQEDFSYKEIADILHIPVATVGIRLSRGKQRLQSIYNERGAYGK